MAHSYGHPARRRRRHRPLRVAGHVAAGVAMVGAAGVLGIVVMTGLFGVLIAAILAVLVAIAKMPVLVMLLVCGAVAVRSDRRRRRRAFAAGTAPLPHRPAPPPNPHRAWTAARARFSALRAAYAAHECDPMAVLRLPALSDVTVPSTARFVDAFAEAQALETETFPPASHAAAFARAVERADRAWHAARDAAERIRLSHLTPAERGAVERVIKLLTTARDSDNDAERLAAYARARNELAKLDRAGVIHLPRAAQAELEVGGRGRLTA